ncbi:MAG: cytochrome c [Actinobacteria bacterium]|nr:cytochrome c [Actinomycetota bacterium]
MTETKTAKALILIVILALAGALVVAGCGGSGGTTTTGQGTAEGKEPNAAETPPAEEEPAEAEEAPAEEEPAEEAEEPAEEEPAEEAPAEESEEASESENRSGESSLAAEGKTVFTTNCGSCHTLQAAGTTGTIGPDLDELEPELALVEHQVINGGGPMPAFGNEGILNAKEIKAVATYVSSVAGKG